VQILRVPADKLPAYVGVEIEDSDYLIANVLSSRAGPALDAPQREAQERVMVQQAAGADELAYADGLKARHKVTVLKPELMRESAKVPTEPTAPAAGSTEKK
jgi:hypothetical protein